MMTFGMCRVPGGIAAVVWLFFMAAQVLAQAAPNADEAKTFGLDVVHQIHVEISETNYSAMQPPSTEGFWAWLGQVTTRRDSHRSSFAEFPWVHATVTINGHAYTNVAIRYKGHYTYILTKGLLKRSLKIDFEHYGDGERFGPLKKMTLNSGIMDSNRMREALAYAAFRDAGVPASRTAFAEVTLSVPGRYDHELLGVYTMIEDVGKPYLKKRFGDSQGLLMKPEGVRSVDYFGEEWEAYPPSYHPSRNASNEEARVIIALARLVEKGDAGEFGAKIGDYLDVDEFLRYLAVSALTLHMDSPLAMGQNYYLYLPDKTKRVVFLPWDCDLTFASWPLGGTPEAQMNMSLLHPHSGQHKLIESLLADKEIRGRYLKIVKDIVGSSFNESELLKKISKMEAVLKEPLAREAKAVLARNEAVDTRRAVQGAGGAPSLRDFVTKRLGAVQQELKREIGE